MTIIQNQIVIPEWAYAYGGTTGTAIIKTIPDDFIVEEHLPFQPEGSGEHVFLQIEKCGENTEYIARLLARLANVRQRDVSFAGLKDRHARTIQWFSVWLPGKSEPDWKQAETENIKVLQSIRHARKLKRGVIAYNSFKLTIKDIKCDLVKLEQQLQFIKTNGIPNYFGVQRFGHQGQNVNKALALFQGTKAKREQRSIYLSAARSYLFNLLLSKRVETLSWDKAILGDVFVFDDSKAYFKTDLLDDSTLKRIESGDIHPAGILFGKGEQETSTQAYQIEDSILSENAQITAGLLKHNLTSDRRAFRVFAKNLHWQFINNSELILSFNLPAGSYATSLLRELFEISS